MVVLFPTIPNIIKLIYSFDDDTEYQKTAHTLNVYSIQYKIEPATRSNYQSRVCYISRLLQTPKLRSKRVKVIKLLQLYDFDPLGSKLWGLEQSRYVANS